MIVIHRRSLGGMVLGTSLLGWRRSSANPVLPAQKLRFIVSRNNSDIGFHELSFDQAGKDLAVHINVQMHVGLGPFTIFHYHHQGEERWRGGQFMSLETQTNDDGDKLHVHAQRIGDHIRVEATGLAPQDLPGTALPLTHWNVACMHAQLFNPQDGTVMQEKTVSRGSELVALANGTRVEATRYALNGKAPINDWYDEKQVWTKLTAKVKDGSSLIYTRQV